MDDLVRAARIIDAARQTASHPQPHYHLARAKHHYSTTAATVKTADDAFAAD